MSMSLLDLKATSVTCSAADLRDGATADNVRLWAQRSGGFVADTHICKALGQVLFADNAKDWTTAAALGAAKDVLAKGDLTSLLPWVHATRARALEDLAASDGPTLRRVWQVSDAADQGSVEKWDKGLQVAFLNREDLDLHWIPRGERQAGIEQAVLEFLSDAGRQRWEHAEEESRVLRVNRGLVAVEGQDDDAPGSGPNGLENRLAGAEDRVHTSEKRDGKERVWQLKHRGWKRRGGPALQDLIPDTEGGIIRPTTEHEPKFHTELASRSARLSWEELLGVLDFPTALFNTWLVPGYVQVASFSFISEHLYLPTPGYFMIDPGRCVCGFRFRF